MNLQVRGTGTFKISFVSDDGEDRIDHQLVVNDHSEISIVITKVKPKGQYPKLAYGSISLEDVPIFNYAAVSQASTSREGGNLMTSELHGERENLKEVVLPRKDQTFLPYKISSSVKSCANFVLRLPVQLSGESRVLIKRFKGDCGAILEAEKASAVSMHHKNILRMIAYHKTENSSVLVFPFAARWNLDKNLPGPVVHGELIPSNIFLRHDLRPLISGFGQARWLHLRQALHITHDRCRLKDFFGQETMTQVKCDVLSFGVLLLRLFCRRSAPEDDRTLIEWARPFLLKGTYPDLLGEDHSEDVDPHGIYTIFSAAEKCTKTRPDSRPCMSEVISILKGHKFCDMDNLHCLKQEDESDHEEDRRKKLKKNAESIYEIITYCQGRRNLENIY
ncbi:hypothetical protein FH972_005877 [Carpinus fangiana]|uniref:Protein kinase domain-containing protein n=1 Tax=Carpinus fangiana TaxID=176857 RepID=A0A5N6QT05_9ROSI|nr:hypothetical protein FH972_005877 [Carpinus fangiana]